MSTTAKSKSSSARTKRPAGLAAPFDDGVLARARALADRYAILVRYEADGESFVGRAIELPHQIGAGTTAEAALRETRALLVTTLATMIESGLQPPPAGAEGPRTEQVNFRLGVEEKAKLEAAARAQGLTLVDYIRASALAPQAKTRLRKNPRMRSARA